MVVCFRVDEDAIRLNRNRVHLRTPRTKGGQGSVVWRGTGRGLVETGWVFGRRMARSEGPLFLASPAAPSVVPSMIRTEMSVSSEG